VTFGNAKAIDLLAYNPRSNRHFSVQVKALRSRNNYWLISPSDIRQEQVYVFVVLNKPGEAVQYFVVPGSVLAEQPGRFGKAFQDPKLPGIHPKSLVDFEGAWQHFETPSSVDIEFAERAPHSRSRSPSVG